MLETYRTYITTPTFPSIESAGLLAPYPQAAFVPGHKRNISFESKNDLCCPQPWRPTSPTASRSRKSKRAVATVELEAEAGQEIQQILFNKTKSRSTLQVSSAADLILTPKPSSTGPFPYRPTKHHYPPHSPFDEDVASAETENACDDLSSSEHSFDPISLRDSCGLRLVLTQSVSPPVLRDQYLTNSTSPLIPEVVTPPLRTHNPLTLNSPFSERRFGREGAEIGLLSVSPPPADDEFWARRHKVISQQAGDFEETLSNRIRSVHLEQDVHGSAAPDVPSLDADVYY